MLSRSSRLRVSGPRVLVAGSLALIAFAISLPHLRAQEPANGAADKNAADEKATEVAEVAPEDDVTLSDRQVALRSRYGQFEQSLAQMARYLQDTDPERADLLRRAIGRSQSERVQEKMMQVATLLDPDKQVQYGDAITRQTELITAMKELLELLRSEDRREDLKAEQKRIEELIRDLKRVIGEEKDVRAATERGEDPDRLVERQEKAAGNVQKLLDKIAGQDAQKNGSQGQPGKPQDGKPNDGKPSDGKPSDGKPSDGKPSDGKPSDGKPSDGKPSDGKPSDDEPSDPKDGKPSDNKPEDGKPKDGKPNDGKPSDGKPSDSKPSDGKPSDGKPSDGKPSDGKPSDGKPSDGKPSDGKPSDGKPSDGKPSDGKPGENGNQPPQEQQPQSPSMKKPYRTPGRDEIEKAKEDLERAIEDLKRRQLDPASDKQDEAIAKLQAAKEQLEEILRQLREEEREMQLRALEARFQHMLRLQKEVYTGTVTVAQIDSEDWTSTHTARINDMFRKEQDIIKEAEQALQLLKEEGSSVAFAEATLSIKTDMGIVARRLNDQKVGEITQVVEQDIIEALSEMVEALQMELDKMQQKKQQQGQPPQGEQPDPELVNKLQELKMLRSLQKRINRRTKLLGAKIDADANPPADLVEQHRELSTRQARVQEVTYDLATGSNK